LSKLDLRFRVIIRTERAQPPAVDEIEQRLLVFVHAKGRSTAEIAAHIGLTLRATQLRLAKLSERGLVIAVGSGPKDPRRKWMAAESNQAT
jgi:DNA-binding MarR family transcriptional regulator